MDNKILQAMEILQEAGKAGTKQLNELTIPTDIEEFLVVMRKLSFIEVSYNVLASSMEYPHCVYIDGEETVKEQ